MEYIKFNKIIDGATPKEKAPKLTPEQIEKIKHVSGAVLALLGVAGIMTVAVVAPGLLAAVGSIMEMNRPNKRFTKREKVQRLTQSFYYLKRTGQIEFSPNVSDLKVYLTNLGRKNLERIQIETLAVKRPARWNKRWWQVAADIPTKEYRSGADSLRQKLKQMNFYPLQRTLWFYPYDPREEVNYIVNYYQIEKFVTVMEVSRLDLDDEMKLKEHFKDLSVI